MNLERFPLDTSARDGHYRDAARPSVVASAILFLVAMVIASYGSEAIFQESVVREFLDRAHALGAQLAVICFFTGVLVDHVTTVSKLYRGPKKYPIHGTTRYGHVFVPAARVAANFFNSASLGYVPPAVAIARRLAILPANFTAYWSGLRFLSGNGLPGLVISQPGESTGLDLFSLMYARADNPYGGPVVALEEFQILNHFGRLEGTTMRVPVTPCRHPVAMLSAVVVICALALPPRTADAAMTLTMTEQPPTVAQIYERVQQSITRPGMLYHATIQRTLSENSRRQTVTIEQWIDARTDTARLQYRLAGYPGLFTTILTKKVTYDRIPDATGRSRIYWDSPLNCDRAGIAASTALFVNSSSDCLSVNGFRVAPGLGTGGRTIHLGQYAGQPALVVREQTVMGAPQAPTNDAHTRRLYLAPDTYLPIAEVTTDGQMDMRTHKRTVTSTQRVLYAHTFVPASSVPATFFDPASIGWRGLAHQISEELAQVPSSVRVYWLGMRFAPGHGLPPLVAQKVLPGNPRDPSSFLRLVYASAGDPFGMGALSITEWSGSASLYPLPQGPGFTRHNLTLPHGHGLIILQPRLHGAWALASFGAKKVLIEPGSCCGLGAQNPYSTSAAMEIGLRALQVRTAHR